MRYVATAAITPPEVTTTTVLRGPAARHASPRPSRIRVFTVPSGSFNRAATWDWV